MLQTLYETVTFSIDDLTKEYFITGTNTGEEVHIYDGYETVSIRIFANNTKPDPEELLPSYSTLYNWASSDNTEIRGEPTMLFLIIFLGIILALDIVFPDLFFTLRYRHYVTGGEPSELYLAGQIFGRFAMVVAIFICMFRSLRPFWFYSLP